MIKVAYITIAFFILVALWGISKYSDHCGYTFMFINGESTLIPIGECK